MMLVIADDLTGALEVGAKFAAHSLQATVLTHIPRTLECRWLPLIIDLETRHLAAAHAAERTRQVAILARDSAIQLIYKKTDSTLRGNIGAEFRALEQIFPEQCITYVPAYPDFGRTVKDGRLFVHGKPVHQTDFVNDPSSPVRNCEVKSVVGDIAAAIIDADCNRDIELAAQAILKGSPPQICAGPAALAAALAAAIGKERTEAVKLPSVSRCLVVNGSLHPASLQQIKLARQVGVFDENWKAFDASFDASGRERALQVGYRVRQILEAYPFEAILVFGGDTAFGIHQALGSVPFYVLGEVMPGVPVSSSGNLTWITKAGGFGPPDLLAQIRKQFCESGNFRPRCQ